MKQRLIIIGARAFGRETCNYARDAGYDVVGFLDDKSDALDGFNGYPPILASVEAYAVKSEDRFVCAVGDSRMREKYVEMIERKRGVFVNVIHPTAYVGPNVKMGVGCIVCPKAVLDCDLKVGNHVDINALSYIPHDCILEDFVTVSPGCNFGGGTILRQGVFLGIGTTTVPHVEIGAYTFVAAGSVVVKTLPPNVRVIGAPARVRESSGA